mmetsp:Transcript_93409/g.302387  ORF Transcript_93409/g.302387 Transcript_93409/m.302387 type:complete len:320 (+) Transcript_93409:804-1763(+)
MGSCGIMEMAFLKVCKPSPAISWPSRITRPDSHSTRRKRMLVMLLFPAPVRPTMPIFSPPVIFNSKSAKASGKPDRYRSETFWKCKAPREGHTLAAGSVGNLHAGSCGKSPSLNSRSLSKEAPFVSKPMMAPMVTMANKPHNAAYEKYIATMPGLSMSSSACENVNAPVAANTNKCKKWHHNWETPVVNMLALVSKVQQSMLLMCRCTKKLWHFITLSSTAPRRTSLKFDKTGAMALLECLLVSILKMAKPLNTGKVTRKARAKTMAMTGIFTTTVIHIMIAMNAKVSTTSIMVAMVLSTIARSGPKREVMRPEGVWSK